MEGDAILLGLMVAIFALVGWLIYHSDDGPSDSMTGGD